MKSIRKFAYAAVLSLSMFTIQPTLAAAEDARGSFTLSHEVHWQNCVLRAGDYSFTIKDMGPAELITLRGLNGTGTDAMLLVDDVEPSRPDEVSKLVLVPRDGQSFVSAMELPNYDMTLHFAVPPAKDSK
jgi:hypothetical protein